MAELPPLTRGEVAAVASGGAAGAGLTYVTQVAANQVTGTLSGLPAATLTLVTVGSLGIGVLLGVNRVPPRWLRALAIGVLCGTTPLACFVAVGLTVRSGSASALFLIGTPVAALLAVVLGRWIGRAWW